MPIDAEKFFVFFFKTSSTLIYYKNSLKSGLRWDLLQNNKGHT